MRLLLGLLLLMLVSCSGKPYEQFEKPSFIILFERA
jgi:hypothetical protein